jgi:hypothetical protein
MSIFVLIVIAGLNCFATRARQRKRCLALAVTMAPSEYSHLSLLFLRVAKDYLPQLGEVLPAVHALPQVVPVAKSSSLTRN